MNANKIITVVTILFLSISSLSAQELCFRHSNSEECPYRIVSEFALSTQLNPSYKGNSGLDISYNLGVQKYLKNDFSLGIHWFFNSSGMGPRARLAYKTDNDIEFSLSPGIIISSPHKEAEKFKGYSIESNMTWDNKWGIVFRVDHHNLMMPQEESATSINLGIQTHGPTSLRTVGGLSAVGLLLLLFGDFSDPF